MGKKYTLKNGMELLKEQLPNVANAFGVLRDEATKDGVLSARNKRLSKRQKAESAKMLRPLWCSYEN